MARPIRKSLCFACLVAGRIPVVGRPFRELARTLAGVYKERRFLGGLTPWPYISPRAQYKIAGSARFGRDVFVDDGCVIFGQDPRCDVILGDRVSIYKDTVIHVGGEGRVEIGSDTHIQNGCQITAFGPVRIGCKVQIAPRCSLYPYDHSYDRRDIPILEQPLRVKKGIVIEDDVWLGVGVTVLDGAVIGKGAVVGAGALVRDAIPPYSIAVGVPARVIGERKGG